MTNFPKKLLLAVLFMVIAVIFYRLGYDRRTADSPVSNQSSRLIAKNQTAAVIDNGLDKLATGSSLLTKSQQSIKAYLEPTSTATNTAMTSHSGAVDAVSVVRVIDGDTIDVLLNNTTTRVRLIGIDSPELNDKRPQVACLAQEAKKEAEFMLNSQKIYLEKDSTQGDYDKYGRLLAYAFLTDDSTNSSSGEINFNKLMIEEGYAYEYTYRLPYKYQNEFKAAEERARESGNGLRGNSSCLK